MPALPPEIELLLRAQAATVTRPAAGWDAALRAALEALPAELPELLETVRAVAGRLLEAPGRARAAAREELSIALAALDDSRPGRGESGGPDHQALAAGWLTRKDING